MPASAAPSPGTVAKSLRIFLAALISLAGTYILTARINPARMDYISYWSTGKLLIHHSDPYSPASVFQLEKSQGFLPPKPLMMRNPPWALFLAAPLGLFSPRTGLFFWTLITAGCILASVRLLIPNANDTPLALLFAPAIACIGSGQSSSILLLGFALFLHFHRTRPFYAGAALLLMAIKPHLFLVFWAALLLDCFYRRTILALAGLASALIAATAFAMLCDPHVWPHYLAMLRTSALDAEMFPTLSMALRRLIDINARWLLFVPSALAVLWSLWYRTRKHERWDWTSHGMLLMLVAIFASPYGWFTDEVVLLPAILFAVYLPRKRTGSVWLLLIINAIAAMLFLAKGAALETPLFLWTPTAWLAWFLYATGNFRAQEQPLGHMKGETAQ
jgi:hypothetical protein